MLKWPRPTPGGAIAGLHVRCWPVTLPIGQAVALELRKGGCASFGELSFQALTCFFAFEVTASAGGRSASTTFVLNLPVDGLPSDRNERLLQSLLQNRREVVRFMLLLLSGQEPDTPEALVQLQRLVSGGTGRQARESEVPLFETLVRTLSRDPGKLKSLARLVEDLKKTPEGAELLPEGFDEIWESIWSVGKRLLECEKTP